MKFDISPTEEILCGDIMVADMHNEALTFELVRRANAFDELIAILRRHEGHDPEVRQALTKYSVPSTSNKE